MIIFISSQRIDDPQTSFLIKRLCEVGINIYHSPRNPLDGEDEKWKCNWYEKGLRDALNKTDVFIASIDLGWGSSTWMGIESDEGLKRLKDGRIKKMYYFNPLHIIIKEKGMKCYLIEQLPDEPNAVIEILNSI
jgi:hypothetical protein